MSSKTGEVLIEVIKVILHIVGKKISDYTFYKCVFCNYK